MWPLTTAERSLGSNCPIPNATTPAAPRRTRRPKPAWPDAPAAAVPGQLPGDRLGPGGWLQLGMQPDTDTAEVVVRVAVSRPGHRNLGAEPSDVLPRSARYPDSASAITTRAPTVTVGPGSRSRRTTTVRITLCPPGRSLTLSGARLSPGGGTSPAAVSRTSRRCAAPRSPPAGAGIRRPVHRRRARVRRGRAAHRPAPPSGSRPQRVAHLDHHDRPGTGDERDPADTRKDVRAPRHLPGVELVEPRHRIQAALPVPGVFGDDELVGLNVTGSPAGKRHAASSITRSRNSSQDPARRRSSATAAPMSSGDPSKPNSRNWSLGTFADIQNSCASAAAITRSAGTGSIRCRGSRRSAGPRSPAARVAGSARRSRPPGHRCPRAASRPTA